MSNQSTKNLSSEEELTIRDGNELKRVLKIAGYSQREVADHIGYSRSYISAVCNGVTMLTLRVTEAVLEVLGPKLFILAIKSARLHEERRRQQEEQRKHIESIAYAHEQAQARQREEERRQAAVEKLKNELEEGSAID